MVRPTYAPTFARPLGAVPFGATKKASNKGVHGSLFDPGGTSAQMWSTNPDKRKVDISGLFGPEDTIIAVARGMHPGILRDMDDRATIRGALTVLKALGVSGYTKVDPTKLKSTTANLKADDDKLAKAAHSTSIRQGAIHLRAVVHKNHLDRAAWGARQLYILDNLKGFAIGHAVAATIVGASGIGTLGVGAIVGAAMAAHGAISAAIAKDIVTKATNDVKAGLLGAKAKKDAAKKTATTTSKKTSARSTASASSSSRTTTAPKGATLATRANTAAKRTSTTNTMSVAQRTAAGASAMDESGAASANAASAAAPSDTTSTSIPTWGWWLGGGVAAAVVAALVLSRKGAAGASGSKALRISLPRVRFGAARRSTPHHSAVRHGKS